MNNLIKTLVLASLIYLLAFVVSFFQAEAQGPPPPNPTQGVQPFDQVQVLRMPPVDVSLLLQADKQATPEPFLRFAQPISVTVSPKTHGTWDQPEANIRRWRLRIISADALSLNLGFSRYVMPAGGRLLLYTTDGEQVIGPFTAEDNETHGQLWTPILSSDDIIIEVTLPTEVVSDLELVLSSVNHGYVDISHASAPDKSGSCNIDVICPEGDNWRDEIRSAARYTVSGSILCSGSLINNTSQDLTPYFLTAYHCDGGIDATNAPSMVVYWNYETSVCDGTPDGSLTQFNSGATFRASYSPSDFALVELDDPITSTFNVHWAGWDKSSVAPSSATTIHHPSGDEKRISLENDPTSTTSYLATAVPGDSTHIRITDWDLGTTEPGSSGAPLFNPNGQIVGQLHGGYASCSNDSSDWYGNLSVSWSGGGTSATRLSDWLDPATSGATTLNGTDPIYDFSLNASPGRLDVCVPDDARYDITVGSNLGFTDSVTLSVSGNPAGTGITLGQNPVTPAGSSALTVTNGSSVTGIYNLNIVGMAPTSTHTSTVILNLIDTPGTVTLITPTNGITNQSLVPKFEWNTATEGVTYTLDVASDAAFNTIIYSAEVTGTSHLITTPLASNTTYYWRVTPENMCGSGNASTSYSFTTLSPICRTPNLPIPDAEFLTNNPGIITDTLIISNSGITIDHFNVSISTTHESVGDLIFKLEHVDTGTSLTMIDRPGYPGSSCIFDDIDVLLEDEAASAVEDACNPTAPAISGVLSPNNPLSTFDNENLDGTWRMIVSDNAWLGEGTLVEWCLHPATNVAIEPPPTYIYLPIILKGEQ